MSAIAIASAVAALGTFLFALIEAENRQYVACGIATVGFLMSAALGFWALTRIFQ